MAGNHRAYDQRGEIKMGQEFFSLVAIFFLIFLYKFTQLITSRLPDESSVLASRLTQLIPSFTDSRNSDLKSFGFCVVVMIFVILLLESLLR